MGRLLHEVRILDLVRGAVPKDHTGRWWLALCPFHDDHHPSLWIDAERNKAGCHAGCTDHPLDALEFYARLYGVTNKEAIARLR